MADPNHIALPEYGIAFYLICKCANTSIKAAIAQSRRWPTRALHSGSHPLDQYRVGWDDMATTYSHLTKFVVVRNPFDRLVSCYADKLVRRETYPPFNRLGMFRNMPFEEFVEKALSHPPKEANQHYRPISQDVYWRGSFIPDVVLYYETLNQDWQRVRSASKIKLPQNLPHENKAPSRSGWREYYKSDKIIDKVLDYYKQDIKDYKYGNKCPRKKGC